VLKETINDNEESNMKKKNKGEFMKRIIIFIILVVVILIAIIIGIPFLYKNGNYKVRKSISFFSEITSPGYGTCMRCGSPWNYIEGHDTEYNETRDEKGNVIFIEGCFPLCEMCWQELETPEKRLPYYRKLWEYWEKLGVDKSPDLWKKLEQAVLKGK